MSETRVSPDIGDVRRLYLELLKTTLTRSVFPESYRAISGSSSRIKAETNKRFQSLLHRFGYEVVHPTSVDPDARRQGSDWPADAETMIGVERLNNIEACIVDVLNDDVPGDLVETGVWRGGAVIFMRGVLKAYGVQDRVVWAADSFEGLPRPNAASYPADTGSTLFQNPYLAVSLEEVQHNFSKFGLLDDQVRFLRGWFRDTLPSAPIERIAVLRLDGDLYESTMDGLRNLYPKVSPGGFTIIDDYYSNETCKRAVNDYRRALGITDAMHGIDDDAVFWRLEAL